MTHYEFRKGVLSGGVLFVLWSILMFLLIIPLRSIILMMQADYKMVCTNIYQQLICAVMSHDSHLCLVSFQDLLSEISFFFTYILVAALFVCSLFSDHKATATLRRRTEEQTPLMKPEAQISLSELEVTQIILSIVQNVTKYYNRCDLAISHRRKTNIYPESLRKFSKSFDLLIFDLLYKLGNRLRGEFHLLEYSIHEKVIGQFFRSNVLHKKINKKFLINEKFFVHVYLQHVIS